MLSGLAGAMFAHVLTVFSAKEFYFDLTFSIIAMMVVGGMASVTGAVAGAILVTMLIEILRRLENGFSFGFVAVPQVFGLTEIGLSLAILAILYTGTKWSSRLSRGRFISSRALASNPNAGR